MRTVRKPEPSGAKRSKARFGPMTNGADSVRREWPEPSEMSPARVSSLAPAWRGPSDQPVRPVPGWRLPSGQLLVEYALRGGLASSPLLVRLPLLGGGAGLGQAAAEPVGVASLAALARGLNGGGRSGRMPSGPVAPVAEPKPVKRATAKPSRQTEGAGR